MKKILIVDDHKIICQGIKSLLSEFSDFLIHFSHNGLDAIEKSKEQLWEIIIMDINMPLLNGIDATSKIKKECPAAKVIALSAASDFYLVSEMFHAGADAFILKSDSFEDLLAAIQTVLQGKEYMSPQLSSNLTRTYYKSGEPSLSQRENQVLRLLALGFNIKTIATDLCISPKTVESHRRNLMLKLNLGNLADLTRYAIRRNLIQP